MGCQSGMDAYDYSYSYGEGELQGKAEGGKVCLVVWNVVCTPATCWIPTNDWTAAFSSHQIPDINRYRTRQSSQTTSQNNFAVPDKSRGGTLN